MPLFICCSTPQRPEIDPLDTPAAKQHGCDGLNGIALRRCRLDAVNLLIAYESSEVKQVGKTSVRIGKTDFVRTRLEFCRFSTKDGKPYKTGLCHGYSYLTYQPEKHWYDPLVDAGVYGIAAVLGWAGGKYGAVGFIVRKLFGLPF
jgi:hypothetical protein